METNMIKTKPVVESTSVPPNSQIARHLQGAYFFDTYEVPVEDGSASAMEMYLASKTWET